jgi:hypothetical protein
MSKFNKTGARVGATSPVKTEPVASGLTYERAPGYKRGTHGELFLLAVANMVGEDTFYERAKARDDRFVSLVRQLAVEDPEWVFEMARWLRSEANMRSASIVVAVEFVKARLDDNAYRTEAELIRAEREAAEDGGLNRRIVNVVLQRADEPGELLGYWSSKYGDGRNFPKAVKRGVADAVVRLYDQYALLKYDTDSKAYRFGDVLEVVHPTFDPLKPWQADLFEHAIDRRHGRDKETPVSLEMVAANAWLREAVKEDKKLLLDPGKVRAAGLTWEDTLSLGGKLKLDKQALWMSMIPSMGYMGLLRNLRNFDDVRLPDGLAKQVADRLSDPERVAKSRQFPFRFLSAYNANRGSLRWAWALEQALNHSLVNVPSLPGRTLILVDRSGSMFDTVSEKSGLNRADSAALFGTALALRSASADLVQFGTNYSSVSFRRGDSILRAVEKFGHMGGTNTASAVRGNFRDHDRVVIVTDEQAGRGWYGGDPTKAVPAKVPVYTWNLAGYKHGHGPSGEDNRHTFGGLTDQAFKMIPLLEAGRNADWPWKS